MSANGLAGWLLCCSGKVYMSATQRASAPRPAPFGMRKHTVTPSLLTAVERALTPHLPTQPSIHAVTNTNTSMLSYTGVSVTNVLGRHSTTNMSQSSLSAIHGSAKQTREAVALPLTIQFIFCIRASLHWMIPSPEHMTVDTPKATTRSVASCTKLTSTS